MSEMQAITIEACSAEGFKLVSGSSFRVINTMGSQVIGAWAFARNEICEYMSMEHSRIHSNSSRPQIGTVFYSNLHKPILRLVADRSPGVHDWFLAACNQQRFEQLGHEGKHANCSDNLIQTLDEFGHKTAFVPCPLNLFENVSLLFGESMKIKQPIAMPGDSVSFEVLTDCLIVLSACPQDILPTNGPELTPKSVEVEITRPDT